MISPIVKARIKANIPLTAYSDATRVAEDDLAPVVAETVCVVTPAVEPLLPVVDAVAEAAEEAVDVVMLKLLEALVVILVLFEVHVPLLTRGN